MRSYIFTEAELAALETWLEEKKHNPISSVTVVRIRNNAGRLRSHMNTLEKILAYSEVSK